MIPAKRHMESDGREDNKDHKGNDLLDDFELHECERSTAAVKAYTIGRHLKAILEEGYSPGEQNNKNEWRGVGKETDVLQFEMAVPGKSHQHVRENQHQYCPESLHSELYFVKWRANLLFLYNFAILN